LNGLTADCCFSGENSAWIFRMNSCEATTTKRFELLGVKV